MHTSHMPVLREHDVEHAFSDVQDISLTGKIHFIDGLIVSCRLAEEINVLPLDVFFACNHYLQIQEVFMRLKLTFRNRFCGPFLNQNKIAFTQVIAADRQILGYLAISEIGM